MKYYFENEDSETCYPLSNIKDMMAENGVDSQIVIEAVKDTSKDYFWCKAIGEICEKDGICGKGCVDYEPRNGKSGCCKHYSSCYTHSDKTKLVKLNLGYKLANKMKKTKFTPKPGQKYWSIDMHNLDVDRSRNIDCHTDKTLIKLGNCFKTKREAESKLKVILPKFRKLFE